MTPSNKKNFPKKIDGEICNLILAIEQCDKRITGANPQSDTQDNSTGNIVDMNISNWAVDEEYPSHTFENLSDAKQGLDKLIIRIDNDRVRPFATCQYGPQIKRKLIALSAHLGMLIKPRSELKGEEIQRYISQVNGIDYTSTTEYFKNSNQKIKQLHQEIETLQQAIGFTPNVASSFQIVTKRDSQNPVEDLTEYIDQFSKAASAGLEKIINVKIPPFKQSDTPEQGVVTCHFDKLNSNHFSAYINGQGTHFNIGIGEREGSGKAHYSSVLAHEVTGHAVHMGLLNKKISNGEIPKCLGLTTVVDPYCPVMEAVAYLVERLTIYAMNLKQIDSETQDLIRLRNKNKELRRYAGGAIIQRIIDGENPADLADDFKDMVPYLWELGESTETEKTERIEKIRRSIYNPDSPAVGSGKPVTDRHTLSYFPVYAATVPAIDAIFQKLYVNGTETQRTKFAGLLKKLYTEYHDYVDFTRLVKEMGCEECLVAKAHDTAQGRFITQESSRPDITLG